MKREFIQKLVETLTELASSQHAYSIEEVGVDELENELEENDDELLEWGCHIIRHFLDDEDIRSVKPKYNISMRAELEELAGQIRKEYLT